MGALSWLGRLIWLVLLLVVIAVLFSFFFGDREAGSWLLLLFAAIYAFLFLLWLYRRGRRGVGADVTTTAAAGSAITAEVGVTAAVMAAAVAECRTRLA